MLRTHCILMTVFYYNFTYIQHAIHHFEAHNMLYTNNNREALSHQTINVEKQGKAK